LHKRAKLGRAYDFIRKEIFPRWDKRKEWTIKLVKDLPSQGVCNQKSRCIEIQRETPIRGSLFLLLTHEICHAATGANHGKKWIGRMLKAAETADRIDKKLAQEIREQVKAYHPDKLFYATVPNLCEEIENAVIGSVSDYSFSGLIEIIARLNGMRSHEFKVAYRRSMNRFRRTFDKAREFLCHEDMMRKKWVTMI
jgi:hypothetical protein